jgi:phosphate transport system permease protein
MSQTTNQLLLLGKPVSRHGETGNWLMWSSTLGLLVIGGGSFLFISLFLVAEAYPALFAGRGLLAFFFIDPWAPLASPPTFGIIHSWISTLLITGLCLVLAVPVGLGIGLFLSDIAHTPVQMILRPAMDLLAGIPSVVYGFFGYVTLLPWFELHFNMATGESVLAAALILSVMVLPFVASTSAEAFRTVPHELREAALAQGVTRAHMIKKIVMVWAAPGVFAAMALGLARAIGETLAVLMLAGNSIATPGSLLDRGQPLTALITTELGEAGVNSEKYHALFAAGLTLMVVIILINAMIWTWKKRLLSHV